MTDYVVPCESPENDPNDWFIEKNGRQYDWDNLLTPEQRHAIIDADYEGSNQMSVEELDATIDAALAEAEAEALKQALQKRRHARDKCHVECYFRTQCLTIALTEPEPRHGTWGGYYPEELRKIRRVRDERQSRQTGTAEGE